ncbi:GH39 family glycosyl hydrolase [Actinotalea fermentans]|uniref:Glycosyl hydrolases family 39 N-terminal catalytic domain-containing protein n=1 Tax=Actinotalea fermentans TaxID=43671 RepID=A0A511Z216_9CELL|nr:hypothetical protein [Actinotalea fermentans]KGM17479.1 hypothetical protein N867_02360 [Actinotalea fermentans ATCC 43279 = JCM 9966 = DSM 3133]GEN81483.1 hypothetical protein AFE02nite_32170 [Actinotalea fermentans]
MRAPLTSATVRIDPTALVDHPLSKERIAIYNSGLVPIERYRRDAAHIAAVRAESLRIDLGWGAEWMPWTREVVTRDERGELAFDFEETDHIARVLAETGTRPYWSYCYVPAAAREPGDDWRTMARDDSAWVRTVASYVSGLRQRGTAVGYHEVYNEPDLRDERTAEPTFYTGDLEDYLELYRATAAAIRAADPAARVGGPALAVAAVHADWLDAFCRVVTDEGLPLDFLSFHHYGHFGLEATLRTVGDVLAAYPTLRDVEWHLNEYNAFSIDYPRGGLQDTHLLASAFAADIPRLLAHRELTRTHWAQFLDSGQGNFSGMVDIDGAPKPIYAVYRFYQHMPVDRVAVGIDGPRGVGAVASASGSAVCAIVWNRHFTDVDVHLALGSAPGAGTVCVIGADGVAPERSLALASGRASVMVPAGGVALIRIGDPEDEPGGRRAWGIALRSDGTGWADLDEATLTFRFGGGTAWSAHAADVPDDAVPDGWDVHARTADGAPADATVVLEIDGVQHVVSGSPQARWTGGRVSRPAPAGHRRIVMAATAPAGTFVTVSPVTGAGR